MQCNHELLLTLARYLQCAQLMQHCEAVLLTASRKESERLLKHCWSGWSTRSHTSCTRRNHSSTRQSDKLMGSGEEAIRVELLLHTKLVIQLMAAGMKRSE